MFVVPKIKLATNLKRQYLLSAISKGNTLATSPDTRPEPSEADRDSQYHQCIHCQIIVIRPPYKPPDKLQNF